MSIGGTLRACNFASVLAMYAKTERKFLHCKLHFFGESDFSNVQPTATVEIATKRQAWRREMHPKVTEHDDVPSTEARSLSISQERFWVLQQLHPGGASQMIGQG